jgi:WD40 repeat protein
MLWTGSAYREFAVWREGYPGGLSATEEAFALAMTALAARRRRRRRLAVAAAGLVLVTVLAVVTTLWRSSVAETRRAEAGKLLALGQMQLEDDPTAALAYARASLELADTPEARRFAVEVLWRGPVARILPVARTAREAGLADVPSGMGTRVLSPDGRWLATSGGAKGRVLLFPHDGGPPRALPRQPDGNVAVLAFGPRGEVLVTGGSGSSMRFWSLPDLDEIRTVELGGLGSASIVGDPAGVLGDGKLLTVTRMDDQGRQLFRIWPLPEGEAKVPGDSAFRRDLWDLDPGSGLLAHRRGRTVLISSLESSDPAEERVVGEAGDVVADVELDSSGERVASLDRSGELRVWSTAEGDGGPLHVFQGPRYDFIHTRFDPTGRYVTQMGPNYAVLLWDLVGPDGTEPRVLSRRVPGAGWSCDFDPTGRWAVTDFEEDAIEFWSLETPWARTFRDVSSSIWSMAFTSDEPWLVVCPIFQPARLWPLNAAYGSPRELAPAEDCVQVATHPARKEILVETTSGEILLYPIAGGPPRRLPSGFRGVGSVSFDPEGRRVIGSPGSAARGFEDPEQRVLAVWDLETDQQRVYSVAHLTDADWTGALGVGFGHDGSVYATLGNGGRLMRLTLPAEPGGEISAETVIEAGSMWPLLSRDGRFLMVHATGGLRGNFSFRYERLVVFDLVEGTSRRITSHGTRLTKVTQIDPTGRILVTGDVDGVVRAGPVTGEEPHLLLGHQGLILSLAISADGRWIVSSDDESVRLWPMPDVTKPPLYTLPHDELMAKLDSFTNLRAVRDDTSATGWKLEVGPFPGWETVPTW